MMDEKSFLLYYLVGTPIIIWTATLILAIIRIWNKNHRDLAEERKKLEERMRPPNSGFKERRVVKRRRPRETSKPSDETAARAGSVQPKENEQLLKK
ncbi:Small integral membrane protein 15 [Caenorhabditis elegans]|uniref:Small integral membrane protein 15 n=1 Tax=Caenorhabditis elegans TaxID=6239 RepID=P91206_CAEEL|nr:Small integral membrane protein 15 [Caenorhabditis elegans]CCD66876.1 Small integral membrane protein 15 [Caenorhabditis elegans]|eukprot:NP_503861.1 Uncharacterized protein CELE_F02C9.1 [Caenorhabditis elegans]